MKTWGSGGIALPFLTSALDGGEWSASRPGRFISGEIAPGTHWIGVTKFPVGKWNEVNCSREMNRLNSGIMIIA
jgi:hypothetical protein